MPAIIDLDLRVNGCDGIDFNDTALTAAALDHALGAMFSSGVNACQPIRCLPQLSSSEDRRMWRARTGH
nr:hypothetical protein [uncultured Rhodopila sp.]